MADPREDPSDLDALKRRDDALRQAGQRLLQNAKTLGEKCSLILTEVERIKELERPAAPPAEEKPPEVQDSNDPTASSGQ